MQGGLESSAEEWLDPVPLEFLYLDAAETFDVHEVAVEEEDVATATLVEGKADNCGVEATDWAVRMSGFLCTYNSK